MKINFCKLCITTFSPLKGNGEYCSPECKIYTRDKILKMINRRKSLKEKNRKNQIAIVKIESILKLIKYNAK